MTDRKKTQGINWGVIWVFISLKTVYSRTVFYRGIFNKILKWGIAASLLSTGCVHRIAPGGVGSPRMVVKGQYLVEAKAGKLWCDGQAEGAYEHCIEEASSGRTFLVTPVADGFAVIREEVESLLEAPEIVPYKKEEDLCFTDFPDDFCEPNWWYTASPEVVSEGKGPPNWWYTADKIRPEFYKRDPIKQWSLDHINAEQGWEIQQTSDVPVAVIDTGVDCSHPEINCVGEYNAITDRLGSGSSFDDNGHGTHCASVIGSKCGNSEGICGVGNGTPILACKFLRKDGGGSLSDAIKCITWAREKGARIINASWGCSGCYSEALLSSIKKSRDAGLLVFAAAAGNSGVNNDTNPHYPSSYSLDDYDPIISVAAVAEDGKRAGFSNYGLRSVDISAPGASICAAYPEGDYKCISGTSMAAPHIAGAASLLVSAGRRAKESILETARSDDGEWSTGGTLDLGQALRDVDGGEGRCKKTKLDHCRAECASRFKCQCGEKKKCKKQCRKKWCQPR